MNQGQKNEWYCVGGWLLTLAAAVLLILFLARCSSSPKLAKVTESVAACESAMSDQVFISTTCTEAQLRIDVVLRTEPSCVGFKPFDVCAVLNDGGVR